MVMPDVENREDQQPPKRNLKDIFDKPPVEPKITEPEPDSSSSTTSKPESETAQEELFREAARKLAAEEEEIVRLGLEYARLHPKPLDPKYFNVTGDKISSFIIADAGYIGMSQKFKHSRVILAHTTLPSKFNLGRRVDINIDTDTHLAIHPDPRGEGKEIVTFYLFDDEGDHTKANFLYGQTALSEMTPEDFEFAGSVLDGIEQKLLAALGRTPPPDQSSITPQT